MIQPIYLQPILFLLLLLILFAKSQSQSCMVQNCLECDDPYICTNCPMGLNCCQQSCFTCVNQTQCIDCGSEFTLNTSTFLCELINSCYQKGCIECADNHCSKCMSGFVLDKITYECILCPVDCSLCTPNGTCLACIPQFFLQDGICQNCIISNCLICENEGNICTRCQIGYYIATPYCNACPLNCQYCTNFSNCLVCQAGYYLTNGNKCKNCASSCQTCSGSVNNCSICNADSYLVKGQCLLCYEAIPLCVTCALNSNQQITCLNCSVSFYVSPNNICEFCGQGCTVCQNSTFCLICQPQYYLTNASVCLPCTITNCEICTNSTFCKTCVVGYGSNPYGLYCFACQTNCSVCLTPTICNICNNGYILSNKICKACPNNCVKCTTNKCLICQHGFYVSNLIGSCLPCPGSCADCASNQTCNYCVAGYYLDSNFNCANCQVPNCFNCNSTNAGNNNSNFCSLCFSGYFLSSSMDQCISCMPNCLICTNDTVCFSCDQGYFLQNGDCMSCLSNCQTCNNGKTCGQCLGGYYFNVTNSSCNSCPTGCQGCSSSNICTSCRVGYYLNQPTSSTISLPVCLKCVSPCLTCVNQSNMCTSCVQGYKINGTNCQSCPLGFSFCDNNLGLLQCFEQYALVVAPVQSSGLMDLECVPCPASCFKCQKFLQQSTSIILKCTQCQIGFVLLNNGSCYECGSTPQTFACQQCDTDGKCSICFKGYTLDQNKNCIISQYYDQQSSDWTYIGTDIGLLSLLMILLIILLYLKLSAPVQPSGLNLQLIGQ